MQGLPSDFPEPRASFQMPVDAPTVDPTVGAFLYRCYSEEWQSAVIGSLLQLLQETTWKSDDPLEINKAQQRAERLIALMMMECDDMPTGAIIWFAGTSAPDGYLICNGAEISRANYAALFAVCGEAFGVGDGETTFNLPDLRGRVAVGTGQQGSNDLYELADSGGEELVQLTVANMPSHAHSDAGHSHTIGGAITGAAVMPGEGPVLVPSLPSVTGTGYANIQETGEDGAHENRQPYLAILPCIRY